MAQGVGNGFSRFPSTNNCECNSSFAIARVKGGPKHVSSLVASASIAVTPLADFTSSPNTRNPPPTPWEEAPQFAW